MRVRLLIDSNVFHLSKSFTSARCEEQLEWYLGCSYCGGASWQEVAVIVAVPSDRKLWCNDGCVPAGRWSWRRSWWLNCGGSAGTTSRWAISRKFCAAAADSHCHWSEHTNNNPEYLKCFIIIKILWFLKIITKIQKHKSVFYCCLESINNLFGL